MKALPWILVMLLIIGCLFLYFHPQKTTHSYLQRDTIVKIDTVRDTVPVPYKVRVVRVDTVYFPILVGDTSRRGSTTDLERESEDALESWIDYGASGEAVYDGPELDSYAADEAGKTKKPVSIKERQNVVRYCSEIDGSLFRPDIKTFKRTQLYTTTVEIEEDKKGNLEEDNYEFQEMTRMSNPMDRNENGMTMTGLYTYFLPAQKGMYFDRYGYPDEEKAITYLTNTRAKYISEGETRALSSFKRKNPMTFLEAFSADGAQTLYDPELINEQLDYISWQKDLTEKGSLKWYKDSPFTIEVVKENGEKVTEVIR